MNQRRTNRQKRQIRVGRFIDDARWLFGFAPSSPEGDGDLRNAEIKVKRALLLDPESYESLVLLAEVCLDYDDEEKTAEAVRYLERAIELSADKPDAYDSLAHALFYHRNKPEEGESCARKALSLSKESGEETQFLELRYMTLIDILVLRQKYAEARWIIKRALRDCPTDFMKGAVEMPLKEIEAAER
jgi:tetratricopeptide (TPR) repeat protein